MNWDDLRFFLAVAREGQILRAAQRLGTSQARVNRRITQFESALDEKLFDRRTVGCSLTPAGRADAQRTGCRRGDAQTARES